MTKDVQHMVGSRRLLGCFTALFWLSGLCGCSVWLDWDPEDLPCANGACAAGYSCLGATCVSDYSQKLGSACVRNQQCARDLICTQSAYDCTGGCIEGAQAFTCQKECYEIYTTSECDEGLYCRPYIHRDDNDRVVGACVASDNCVTSDSQCPDGRDCVTLGVGASACLNGCEADFDASGYSDNCAPAVGNATRACQPVGAVGFQQLVCTVRGGVMQGVGDVCDPVVKPCQGGLACVGNICYRFCARDAAAGTPGACPAAGESCCELDSNNDFPEIGYCRTGGCP